MVEKEKEGEGGDGRGGGGGGGDEEKRDTCKSSQIQRDSSRAMPPTTVPWWTDVKCKYVVSWLCCHMPRLFMEQMNACTIHAFAS